MATDPHGPGRIRLICIDVDGTLVGSNNAVPPAIWPAAARARAAGTRLALCTGRPGFGVARDLAQRLDPDGWHAFQNGGSVVHRATGASRSVPIRPDLIRHLIDQARTSGEALELYTDDEYAVEVASDRARAHAALLGVPFLPRPFSALSAPPVRAQWLLSHATGEALAAVPVPGLQISPSTSPVMPETLFLNITPAGIDKSTAVRALVAGYGITLEEVMYVGDARNDVPAMRIVGYPVAMGNAEAEAIAVAHRVVGTVDEGGLVEALEAVG